MATHERPLSPHLQVYRPQITTVLSIVHRLTGVFLSFGAFGFAWVLLAVSKDPAHSNGHTLDFLFDSPVFLILMLAFLWSLVYHLLNGVRHLFWDAGKGFEIKQFTTSGWVVVVLSLVLTAGLILAPSFMGGAR